MGSLVSKTLTNPPPDIMWHFFARLQAGHKPPMIHYVLSLFVLIEETKTILGVFLNLLVTVSGLNQKMIIGRGLVWATTEFVCLAMIDGLDVHFHMKKAS